MSPGAGDTVIATITLALAGGAAGDVRGWDRRHEARYGNSVGRRAPARRGIGLRQLRRPSWDELSRTPSC